MLRSVLEDEADVAPADLLGRHQAEANAAYLAWRRHLGERRLGELQRLGVGGIRHDARILNLGCRVRGFEDNFWGLGFRVQGAPNPRHPLRLQHFSLTAANSRKELDPTLLCPVYLFLSPAGMVCPLFLPRGVLHLRPRVMGRAALLSSGGSTPPRAFLRRTATAPRPLPAANT